MAVLVGENVKLELLLPANSGVGRLGGPSPLTDGPLPRIDNSDGRGRFFDRLSSVLVLLDCDILGLEDGLRIPIAETESRANW